MSVSSCAMDTRTAVQGRASWIRTAAASATASRRSRSRSSPPASRTAAATPARIVGRKLRWAGAVISTASGRRSPAAGGGSDPAAMIAPVGPLRISAARAVRRTRVRTWWPSWVRRDASTLQGDPLHAPPPARAAAQRRPTAVGWAGTDGTGRTPCSGPSRVQRADPERRRWLDDGSAAPGRLRAASRRGREACMRTVSTGRTRRPG